MKTQNIASQCVAMVAPAESAFHSRWHLRTLARINPELHDRLVVQIGLYETALVTGSDSDAKIQSEAMVRGWAAACKAMEADLTPDDAYQTGIDYLTGTRVVIGSCKASAGRVQAIDGERVIFVSPDEVACILGGLRSLSQAKSLFPDAEVIEMFPGAREAA